MILNDFATEPAQQAEEVVILNEFATEPAQRAEEFAELLFIQNTPPRTGPTVLSPRGGFMN